MSSHTFSSQSASWASGQDRAIDLSDLVFADDIISMILFQSFSDIVALLNLWDGFCKECSLDGNVKKTKVMILRKSRASQRAWKGLRGLVCPADEELHEFDDEQLAFLEIPTGATDTILLRQSGSD